ncbi:MAG: DUF2225 domain-containing protein [candidate division Zixibacteria bacterium]|nr:DUF2225 domain-containing protein [candidate division Zixibacteria bacterium]NIR65991.1 DUF2225 domain-containing protein [candidate division Zixibacteria bacterium]NIS16948.1 DUF2225 domain-containing protein [candidate division Zixibacteria bacterium]NIT53329.1 DUF2225 domain-containing protein [candidate division Zixibacteria bacterium]NIU15726.1 DUF2225 domain-containing protein [candidate division Zixibacteria bacterium]
MIKQQDSPIINSTIECPVCGTVYEVETIKAGAYIEDGRDTDFCPLERKWNNPDFQKYNPLLFFMALCPNCYFTREFTSRFKEWKSDTVFINGILDDLKEKHLHALENDEEVINGLASSIDADRYPFQTAIIKMLLGIYDEKLKSAYSNLDLGRYFLRIAWLFREYSQSDEIGEGQLARLAMRIEDSILRLSGSYEKLREEKQGLARASVEFVKDPHFPEGDKKRELSECYNDAFSDLEIAIEKYKSAVVKLKGSISSSSEVIGASSELLAPLEQPFDQNVSFREYLQELKTIWPEVPVSEHEAMSSAANYYKAAYEEGREIPAGQAIQAVYLIAELSRRIAKHEEASEYFDKSIKLAQEYISANKGDRSRTALARRILELAMQQGELNLKILEHKKNVSA